MGFFHLKPPSSSNKIFSSHQGLKDSSPRTTPLFPWSRTLFKPPGASSPLPALPQQCWSPAPTAISLSQSYQATCVLHSNPDLVCPWGDAKYWVLVLSLCPLNCPAPARGSGMHVSAPGSMIWGISGLLLYLPYPPFLGHFLFWKKK